MRDMDLLRNLATFARSMLISMDLSKVARFLSKISKKAKRTPDMESGPRKDPHRPDPLPFSPLEFSQLPFDPRLGIGYLGFLFLA